jgi:hypothetical protein
MSIKLKIDGYLNMTIKYLNGQSIAIKDKDIEEGILDNLQMGEYVIGFEDRCIYDINDLDKPLYRFELEPTHDIEYEYEPK